MLEENIFGSILAIAMTVVGFFVLRNEAREIDKKFGNDAAPSLAGIFVMAVTVIVFSLTYIPHYDFVFAFIGVAFLVVGWAGWDLIKNGYQKKYVFDSNGLLAWREHITISVITYEMLFGIFHILNSINKILNLF
ncbi:hypothetical protein [Gluconobacter sp. OJB]|uniref:hypothetical protein n=1 Tax=Gluconobacter sp. OJB TaxID=3145196 RepID=UPI0031FA2812